MSELDHERIAKIMGSEIVGRISGPIHGAIGAANVARQVSERMRQLNGAEAKKGADTPKKETKKPKKDKNAPAKSKPKSTDTKRK